MKKKSVLEKLTPLVVGTCMLTLVASCGSDDDDSNSSPQQQTEQQEGTFTGVLVPINTQINDGGSSTGGTGSGTTTGDTGTTTGDTGTTTGSMNSFAAVGGTVSLTRDADTFEATVDATDATSAIHMQHVHAGSRCPTAADDTNGDGYVDAVEASAVSGGALIPLDSDLRTQSAGGVYPSGSNYSYNESTSFAIMLADLQLPDTDTSDSEVKLAAGEELNLGSRVVEIHGVPSSTTLPPTVQGVDGMSPQQSLPIACAVLTRSPDSGSTTGETGTGTTTGETGTTTGETGTTTGTTTGETGASAATTTGETGTTTGM